jgi:hypothetical protein
MNFTNTQKTQDPAVQMLKNRLKLAWEINSVNSRTHYYVITKTQDRSERLF